VGYRGYRRSRETNRIRHKYKKAQMKGLSGALKKGTQGFTLIEILIVLAILGVLAAVVIPRFISLYGRGEAEAAETEQRIAQTALISYMTENGERSVVAKTDQQLGPDYNTDISVDGDNDPTLGSFFLTITAYEYTWAASGFVEQGAKVE
jgi:prepilin-type N-terminal cleavage/methylation domain-containing protein